MSIADIQLDFVDFAIAVDASPAVKACGIEILFDNGFIVGYVHIDI